MLELSSWAQAGMVALLLLFVGGCAQPVEEGQQSEATDHVGPLTIEAEVVEQADPAALDLSRDSLDEVPMEPIELEDNQALLEDLFDEPEEKRTKLSGKVLTDEEASTLEDRMDGVELKLEMKTD